MGMDCKGMLFYGIAYDEGEEGTAEAYGKSWDYELEKRAVEVPEPGECDIEREKCDPEWAAKWTEWREKVKEWDQEQCDIRHNGHSDYYGVIAYVRASYTSVEWTETAEVTTDRADTADWDEKLKLYCADLGLPWRQPKWLLATSYG